MKIDSISTIYEWQTMSLWKTGNGIESHSSDNVLVSSPSCQSMNTIACPRLTEQMCVGQE